MIYGTELSNLQEASRQITIDNIPEPRFACQLTLWTNKIRQ